MPTSWKYRAKCNDKHIMLQSKLQDQSHSCSLRMSHGLGCVVSTWCMSLATHCIAFCFYSAPPSLCRRYAQTYTHPSLKHRVFDHSLFIHIWIECCNCTLSVCKYLILLLLLNLRNNLQWKSDWSKLTEKTAYGLISLRGMSRTENSRQKLKTSKSKKLDHLNRVTGNKTNISKLDCSVFSTVFHSLVSPLKAFGFPWHKNCSWSPGTRTMVLVRATVIIAFRFGQICCQPMDLCPVSIAQLSPTTKSHKYYIKKCYI